MTKVDGERGTNYQGPQLCANTNTTMMGEPRPNNYVFIQYCKRTLHSVQQALLTTGEGTKEPWLRETNTKPKNKNTLETATVLWTLSTTSHGYNTNHFELLCNLFWNTAADQTNAEGRVAPLPPPASAIGQKRLLAFSHHHNGFFRGK